MTLNIAYEPPLLRSHITAGGITLPASSPTPSNGTPSATPPEGAPGEMFADPFLRKIACLSPSLLRGVVDDLIGSNPGTVVHSEEVTGLLAGLHSPQPNLQSCTSDIPGVAFGNNEFRVPFNFVLTAVVDESLHTVRKISGSAVAVFSPPSFVVVQVIAADWDDDRAKSTTARRFQPMLLKKLLALHPWHRRWRIEEVIHQSWRLLDKNEAFRQAIKAAEAATIMFDRACLTKVDVSPDGRELRASFRFRLVGETSLTDGLYGVAVTGSGTAIIDSGGHVTSFANVQPNEAPIQIEVG